METFLENASLVFNRKKEGKQLQDDLKEKDQSIDSLYKAVCQLTLKVNWAEKLETLAFELKRQMVSPTEKLSIKVQCKMRSFNRLEVEGLAISMDGKGHSLSAGSGVLNTRIFT